MTDWYSCLRENVIAIRLQLVGDNPQDSATKGSRAKGALFVVQHQRSESSRAHWHTIWSVETQPGRQSWPAQLDGPVGSAVHLAGAAGTDTAGTGFRADCPLPESSLLGAFRQAD